MSKMGRDEDLRGTWLGGHAGMFFKMARSAYQASVAGGPESKPPWNAATAIVFSQAASEAFVNEIIALAQVVPDAHPSVRRFASIGKELIKQDINVGIKFLLARVALGGELYDKGANPYADFAFLNKLRNSLVHMKSLAVRVDTSAARHKF